MTMHTSINNLARLITLLAALCLQAASDHDVVAQETSGPILPQFPIEPIPELPAQPVAEPETAPYVIDQTRDSQDAIKSPSGNNDFWIVSARHCPQSGAPRCTPQQYQYIHGTAVGRFTNSNFKSYKMQINSNAPICFVVHGSYSTWNSLVQDSAVVNRWLRSSAPNQPLQVVFFTWPSEPITAVLPTVDIGLLGRRASYNGFYLSQLIQETPENARISFFAHSHGTRVVAASLQLLDGGALHGYQLSRAGKGQRTLRPVFAAAAIDHHWLNPGERFGRALNQIDKGLVLFNERDLALTIYPLRRLFSHRPLGLVGFDRKDRQLQNGRAQKLTEYNVTRQIQTGHLWSHYLAKQQIANVMHPYLFFDEQQHPRGLESHVGRVRRSNIYRPVILGHPTSWRKSVIRESSSHTGCIPIAGPHGTIQN